LKEADMIMVQIAEFFILQVGYKNRLAFLILATYGDIFESQVVATEIDARPCHFLSLAAESASW